MSEINESEEKTRQLILECRSYTDYDAAALLCHMVKIHEGNVDNLSNFLSTVVFGAVMKACSEIGNRALQQPGIDSEQIEKFTEYSKGLLNFATKLKTTSVKKTIIAEYELSFC